jgi:hypothetical protein
MKSYYQLKKAKLANQRFDKLANLLGVLAIIIVWYFIIAGILDQLGDK